MAVVEPNAPLPETKPTRHWDAWTREEEENFFGALRQVGKNFEKITSRVQSKNKDQVRHYYYRVIKRMNRILAPTLILDAKNSTYVNNAMLRWWSLLEKHSCSASKLRLKPRRFKTFVTALEHQLLKDHKKVKTKKPAPAPSSSRRHASQADATVAGSSALPEFMAIGSGVSRAGDDLQSTQTAGAGRRTAVKRKAAGTGQRKSGPKVEAKRPPRPRKKATDGNISKAAYAKWEKAASVGVSLMAEAAEQLERSSATDPTLPICEASEVCSPSTIEGNHINVDVQTGQIPPGTSAAFSELGLTDKIMKEFVAGLPAETRGRGGVSVSSQGTGSLQTAAFSSALPSLKGALPNAHHGIPGGLVIIPELCAQVKAKSLALDSARCDNCSTLRPGTTEEARHDAAGSKLRLQLFPLDDFTRNALEQDGLNPHLELTFKPRKSISSVLQHLTHKWGRSSVASGELRLFPYSTQWSSVSGCKSWSNEDGNVIAADVHAAVGSPTVFRLRYAWLSTRVLESSSAVLQQQRTQAESGPVLARGNDPRTRSEANAQDLQISHSIGSAIPAGGGLDQLALCDQRVTLPISAAECGNGDTNLQPGLPRFHERLQVEEQCPGSDDNFVHRSSIDRVRDSKCQASGKIASSTGVQPLTVELDEDKDFLKPVQDLESFTDGEEENTDRSILKEHETASQVSGCGWLYESNDGFAQQMWSYEDNLRSSNGVSIAQMDWVDSLTNLSVSELLGEASRAAFSTPLDCPRLSNGPTQLSCPADSFGISIGGQEFPLPGSMSVSMGQTSSGIWGGEETCDAFSFQRLERCRKETLNPQGEQASANSHGGLDAGFDFRSMGCWREGDSLVAFQQSQDLLFGGDASIGLGGLIEALAQGSLDSFQTCVANHGVDLDDIDQAGIRDCADMTEAETDRGRLLGKDKNGLVVSGNFCGQGRTDELLTCNSDLLDSFERMPETTTGPTTGHAATGSVTTSEGAESLKDSKPVNARLQRKKDLLPAQKPFKLPGQFSAARSLKLQG